MTRKTLEDRRTEALQRELTGHCDLPLINGYTLTRHAALRMVIRHIEIDWVAEALTKPSRPSHVPGTSKHWGERAMCVVNRERVIVTVGFGTLNGGIA